VKDEEMKKQLSFAVMLAATVSQAAFAQMLTPDQLAQRTIERRAIEAVIWGMPAVNYDLMLQAAVGVKGKPNQVIYWSRLPDWKNQTLTPNPDVIYLMPLDGQLQTSGLAVQSKAIEAAPFVARIRLDDSALANSLPAGSTGTAAIFTDRVKAAHVIRKVLLRQIAITNYVNPF
jgi:hypothetical protein